MPNQNSQQRQGDRLVIGITGRIGAGKTSVGKYLESQHGFSYVRYSQVLSDWRAKDPESKAHLQVVGWEVMAGGMQAELNARLISEIPPESNCAVDGLRHSLDFESLNTAFSPHFFLVYVNSPPELRWRRLQRRYLTLDDFQRADSHPVEQQIEALRGSAFVALDNESSMTNLYSKVDDVLVRIRTGGPR
ncbi:MAG: AAA family ATPase [Candidatus Sulfotelmatobacter sp.]